MDITELEKKVDTHRLASIQNGVNIKFNKKEISELKTDMTACEMNIDDNVKEIAELRESHELSKNYNTYKRAKIKEVLLRLFKRFKSLNLSFYIDWESYIRELDGETKNDPCIVCDYRFYHEKSYMYPCSKCVDFSKFENTNDGEKSVEETIEQFDSANYKVGTESTDSRPSKYIYTKTLKEGADAEYQNMLKEPTDKDSYYPIWLNKGEIVVSREDLEWLFKKIIFFDTNRDWDKIKDLKKKYLGDEKE